MSIPLYVVAILGLALLMVVHEAGHYFAARRFGMRVIKFSASASGRRSGSTSRRTARRRTRSRIIPFLAYVQIAGMNPYEENDPKDPGSYMNASLWGRAVTMAAGPLTNYFFASVLIFLGLMLGGDPHQRRREHARHGRSGPGATRRATSATATRSSRVNGAAVAQLGRARCARSASTPARRSTSRSTASGVAEPQEVTPAPKGTKYEGKILIGPFQHVVPVGIGEAAKRSVIEPPMVVYGTIRGISRWISGKEKAEMSGPPGIVKEIARARRRARRLLRFARRAERVPRGVQPAAVPRARRRPPDVPRRRGLSRRKPDAKLEARSTRWAAHAARLIAVVSWFDIAKR
jgi:regulator of sigma E protease